MQLKDSWITDPVFDFEYKKYRLLAYLQQKKKALDAYRIYPHIKEISLHLASIRNFIASKDQMDGRFRKELEGIDTNELSLKFKQHDDNNEGLDELLRIVEFSGEKLSSIYEMFASEAESLSQIIKLDLIGLLPGYRKEGFLLIRQERGIYLFSYGATSLLDNEGEVNIKYHYVRKYPFSVVYKEESIKNEVIREYRDQFDHPAVFSISSVIDLPIYETILPISTLELKKWVA